MPKLLALPEGLAFALPFITVAGVLLYAILAERRFARQSRGEQPARFTLAPTTPESLIGRQDQDGKPGCGKSALAAAGLVPKLRAAEGPCNG